MHLTGFCSEANEMEKPQFCFESQRFFQTTESSLEMKAIKKKKNLFKLRFVVFVFLFEARGAGGENMVRRPFSVFTALTYRWHH